MLVIVFFFEHKTAYEMRISDGSSDVCSSDLVEVTGSYRSSGGPFPVTTADVDGDGTVDVVMAASTGQVRVYNGVGDGTIEATPTLLPITGVTSQIVASDLDGDGDEDLVTARSEERRVGKSVSVRVDLGGSRIIKKKKNQIRD